MTQSSHTHQNILGYVWTDEVTQNKYPAKHSMMFVNLDGLAKDQASKAGELAAFLLGKLKMPMDKDVAAVAAAYDRTFAEFKLDKGAITVMSYAEEREAIGEAKGKAEGMAEGEAKGKAEGMAEGEAKGKAEGMAEGEAKGKAEGIEETKIETALKMLRLGMDIDIIVEVTGLSIEAVIELQKEADIKSEQQMGKPADK